MKLIADLSNLCWTYLQGGIDKEDGRKVSVDGKQVQVNSAGWAFDFVVEFLVSVMKVTAMTPRDLIFVEETGATLGFRRQIDPNYKTGRGKKPDEAYVEFAALKELIKLEFLRLGAQFVTQDGAEADDVIAYLANELEEGCIILSTDADMQACVSDKAHLYYKGRFNENRLGPFPIRFTTLYKATVGDTSDTIKGAQGFGDKAFLAVYAAFGDQGLEALEALIAGGTLEQAAEDVPECKVLQRLIDDRENVYLSYQLAKLYPGRINTLRKPLLWEVGYPATPEKVHPLLSDWQPKKFLVTNKNYAVMLKAFAEAAQASPYIGMDIETTSPEESTLWLAERKAKATIEDGILGDDIEIEKIGVDVLGQTLCGMSLTFGDNGQYTYYLSHNHRDTDNLSKERVTSFVKAIPENTPVVIHNVAFELSVLQREIGELLRDNGWHGFIPNAHDTRILGSYVNETRAQGLKDLSQIVLSYQQRTYEEVTQGRKMHELSGQEVLDYACDDTICCSALYNNFKTICQLEHTWQAFLAVEIEPAYVTAKAFNDGAKISMQTLLAQEKDDQQDRDAAWVSVRDFLIERGWNGTICPTFSNTAASIKQCFEILTGEVLETKVRTPEKMLALIEATEHGNEVGWLFRDAIVEGHSGPINERLLAVFDGEPKFNFGSPKQKQALLYEPEGLGLPVRVRKPPTDNMRAKGIYEGSASTDDLALQYALKYDAPEGSPASAVIKAIQAINIAETRQKLYYTPYKFAVHWATGLVHAYLNQCATVTRRYSSSGPNVQQLPKHPKATGQPARFREVYVPHKKGAVIVSLDFDSQELRLIADYSRDPNMLACFVGDNLQDMHSMTGFGVLSRRLNTAAFAQVLRDAGKGDIANDPVMMAETRKLLMSWTAQDLKAHNDDKTSDWNRLCKTFRALGKKINFTTEYGAMAPKLAKTMLVEEAEAQVYIDAKEESFHVASAWKQSVITDVRKTGNAYSKMGAIRHLREPLLTGSTWEAMAAERQAVNYRIQGSGGEMTKMAMARIWRSGVLYQFDCRFLFPVHDEVVFSVMIEDLYAFLSIVHPLMTAQFADMVVPVLSSISFGPNFGQQYEIGTTVSKEAINEALVKFVKL